MNRSKSNKLPQMQIQFLQSVCVPMYHVMIIIFLIKFSISFFLQKSLSLCNQFLQPMLDGCNDNLKNWQKLIANQNENKQND